MKSLKHLLIDSALCLAFLCTLLLLVTSDVLGPPSREVPLTCDCVGKTDCFQHKFLVDDVHYTYCAIAEEGTCCTPLKEAAL